MGLNTDPLHDLIYDWNLAPSARGGRRRRGSSLMMRRCGTACQSPSVTDPSIDEKIRILHFQNDIGSIPRISGCRAQGRTFKRAWSGWRGRSSMRSCPSKRIVRRTVESDIRPIVEISQRVGIPIEACTFIGSSPIRQFAEEWDSIG